MTEGDVLKATGHFITRLECTDRDLRQGKSGTTLDQAKKATLDDFWELIKTIDDYKKLRPTSKIEDIKVKCRAIVTPWLFRSDYFNRSFYKPHGYAGDYRLIEWIYDLKNSQCDDSTKPGIVNCLDYIFSQLPSVQSAWERRKYFADLMRQEYDNFMTDSPHKPPFRILDVACGSSRYTSDFMLAVANTSQIEVTLVDQDAAALEYCRAHSLAGSSLPSRLDTHCFPVMALPTEIQKGKFDVVVSAGLFDYLDDAHASALLAHMIKLTIPRGIMAVANFDKNDPTETVLQWLVDWTLVYRSQGELSQLFPQGVNVDAEKKGQIAYVKARR